MSVGGSLTPLLTQEMGGDRVPPLGSASDANASPTERASLPTPREKRSNTNAHTATATNANNSRTTPPTTREPQGVIG